MVHLEGDCGVEDAEALVAALAAAPNARVHLSQCRQLHGAVVQALLVFGPEILGSSPDSFLTAFVAPALTQPTEDTWEPQSPGSDDQ